MPNCPNVAPGEDEVYLTARSEFSIISEITTSAWDNLFGEGGFRASGTCPGCAPEGHPNLVVTIDSEDIIEVRLLGPWGEYSLYNSENGFCYTQVDDYPHCDVDPAENKRLYQNEIKGALTALVQAASDWRTAVDMQLSSTTCDNRDAPESAKK